MKKKILFLFFILASFTVKAYDVKIDGIYYNLISKGETQAAEVTSNPSKYTGSIIIPGKITYNGIEYVVISIGNKCFSECTELISVTMPNSIRSIGDNAFSWCSSLTSLSIPNTVISIGNYAFSECYGLITLSIPNSVTSIGSNAFSNCTGLTTLIIPNSVSSIGDYLCEGCLSLRSVTISNNINKIGTKAFKNCEKLESIIIPNGVLSIGYHAFENCSKMTSITIPASLTSIDGNAFRGCVELKRVDISNLTSWCKIKFANYQDSNPLACTGGRLYLNGEEIVNLIIPDDVNTINDQAFTNCSSIKSVTLGEKVVSIGNSAFSNCCKLNTVIIGNNIKSIGYASFYGCSELSLVKIGGGMISIGSRAFENCSKLSDVYCYAKTVPKIEIYYEYDASTVFKGAYIDYATLHVPAESVDAYKATEPWKYFGRVISVEGGETPNPQKCERPTISYNNGQLIFTSFTDGVEFVSEITNADVRKFYEANVTLTVTYNISVYATKAGYENSETATATLCWVDQQPMTEGVSNNISQIPARAVLIQSQDGLLTIQGVDEGTDIAIYTISGQMVSSTKASDNHASFSTNIKKGEVAIIKIGEKSVKVVIQ